MTAEANLILRGNDAFHAGANPIAGLDDLHGLSRERARKKIVELMEERELLERIEPHPHMVPHGDRSGVIVEPWLTDQWYVDAKDTGAAGPRSGARGQDPVRSPRIGKDLFSNGWRISSPGASPASSGGGIRFRLGMGRTGKFSSKLRKGEAAAAARAHYGVETPLTRDEDVLDTWFSSGLWPFSTLGWPDESLELKRYYPTNVLVTGFDIIFFWVARMMMMGMHFMHEIPFRDVYIHALVRDEKGAKCRSPRAM